MLFSDKSKKKPKKKESTSVQPPQREALSSKEDIVPEEVFELPVEESFEMPEYEIHINNL